MKALREAKAYLARGLSGVRTGSHTEIALLAALVEAVEAAPVVEADEDSMVFCFLAEDMAGQRVRVLAVGEESNG